MSLVINQGIFKILSIFATLLEVVGVVEKLKKRRRLCSIRKLNRDRNTNGYLILWIFLRTVE